MRFATDNSLGKLGRYLRAAGFDTVCAHEQSRDGFFTHLAADRIILTRTRSIARRWGSRRMLFIERNDPWQQLAQVIDQLGIRQADTKPFSRCLQCNQPLEPVDRAAVQSRVPAYVWQAHSVFYQCGRCIRIYWAGTHRDRMARGLSSLFQPKGHHA